MLYSFMLDGPRGSLRRLRSQLAEDGCPESQVILAKHLLEEKCGKNFIIMCMLTLNFKNELELCWWYVHCWWNVLAREN